MRILSFGSLNLDFTYKIPHIVTEGETITSSELTVYPGGKGLNQSVALSKAGMEVYHAGMIGTDGSLLLDTCKDNGIHLDYIKTIDFKTGNAIIQVDENGQNSIILYPGSNRQITKDFVDEVLSNFEEGDLILLQNEINHLNYIINQAYEKGMRIILNPSPFDHVIKECNLEKVALFILNEVEAAQMTGEENPETILKKLASQYKNAEFVLTLGGNGSIYFGEKGMFRQEIYPTNVVDTTGAGDTFTGYFISEYYGGKSPKEALQIAAMAASIAVSKKGAAIAIPKLIDVKERLKF